MDRYEPTSDFLMAVINEDAPLSGSIFGDANLALLMRMTRAPDIGNRDWATFLLAQSDLDSDAIRQALAHAALDDDEIVRAEAIAGLARRDRHLALPLIERALAERSVPRPIFEAAAHAADPGLLDALRRFGPASSHDADDIVTQAMAACESGTPPAWLAPATNAD